MTDNKSTPVVTASTRASRHLADATAASHLVDELGLVLGAGFEGAAIDLRIELRREGGGDKDARSHQFQIGKPSARTREGSGFPEAYHAILNEALKEALEKVKFRLETYRKVELLQARECLEEADARITPDPGF